KSPQISRHRPGRRFRVGVDLFFKESEHGRCLNKAEERKALQDFLQASAQRRWHGVPFPTSRIIPFGKTA
ncbi:MAG: hypothetical protein LBO79_02200, partial [Zoogloeaceae bacterium]|nr:hypothetical protein [Zoogloeaceae bacterium]